MQEFISLMLVSGSKCVHLKLSWGCKPLWTCSMLSQSWEWFQLRNNTKKKIRFLHFVVAVLLFCSSVSMQSKGLECHCVVQQKLQNCLTLTCGVNPLWQRAEKSFHKREVLSKSLLTSKSSHVLNRTLQNINWMPLRGRWLNCGGMITDWQEYFLSTENSSLGLVNLFA